MWSLRQQHMSISIGNRENLTCDLTWTSDAHIGWWDHVTGRLMQWDRDSFPREKHPALEQPRCTASVTLTLSAYPHTTSKLLANKQMYTVTAPVVCVPMRVSTVFIGEVGNSYKYFIRQLHIIRFKAVEMVNHLVGFGLHFFKTKSQTTADSANSSRLLAKSSFTGSRCGKDLPVSH